MDVYELPLGQLLARTRWDTHASGLAFDRKKTSLIPPRLFAYLRPMRLLGLHVRQALFHCPKYIKTRIPGLTEAVASPSEASSLREEPVVVCCV